MNDTETPSTVLIVEDQPDACGFIKAALDPSYKVLTAANRDEALRILAGQHVDLILLDYWMPGTSASVFMNRVRTLFPHIRVIVITAQGHAEAVAQLLSIESYLPKPFTQGQLLEIVKKTLAPRSA